MLDATKIIPEEVLPVRVIGRMVLNRNPDNFFAETEQVAFCPANIVPGIDFTNDPLLQGRLFSYLDTQKSRLGTTNFHQIPINAPKCPMQNFQRDGMMQMMVPKGRANYEPNSLAARRRGRRPARMPGDRVRQLRAVRRGDEPGDKLRVRPELFADHYSQARLFFASQTEIEQAHLASAFVFELSKVGLIHVRERMLANWATSIPRSPRASPTGSPCRCPRRCRRHARRSTWRRARRCRSSARGSRRCKGRKVGILFAEGSDKAAIDALVAAVTKGGGTAFLVAPKVGELALKGGKLAANGQLAGSPSVLFDAVACAIMPDQAQILARDGAALQWFMDAYGHCKTIGYCPATKKFILDKLGIEVDAGVVPNAQFAEVAPARHWDREPKVRMLA